MNLHHWNTSPIPKKQITADWLLHKGAALIPNRLTVTTKKYGQTVQAEVLSLPSTSLWASSLGRLCRSELWRSVRRYARSSSKVSISISWLAISTRSISICIVFSITPTALTGEPLKLMRTAGLQSRKGHFQNCGVSRTRLAGSIIFPLSHTLRWVRASVIGNGIWAVRDYHGKRNWSLL